jgi:hypothetical protein
VSAPPFDLRQVLAFHVTAKFKEEALVQVVVAFAKQGVAPYFPIFSEAAFLLDIKLIRQQLLRLNALP